MSPILKRDVSETLRQARRLASAVTGSATTISDDIYMNNGEPSTGRGGWYKPVKSDEVFVTGADRRKGIGRENGDTDQDMGFEGRRYPDPRGEALFDAEAGSEEDDEEVMLRGSGMNAKGWEGEVEEGGQGERTRMLDQTSGETRLERLDYEEVEVETGLGSGLKSGQMRDLRNLLCEVSRAMHLTMNKGVVEKKID